MKGDSEEARIVEVARRLFAELGYDGTSAELIADAAGVDVATLTELTGGRLELYYTVMRRAHEAEVAALRAALDSFTPTREGLIGLVDAYLDFHLGDPWVTWLWMQRWMGDAVDTADLEQRYRRPLTDMVAEAVAGHVPDDVDLDFLLWTVAWSIAGFLSHGLPRGGTGTRRGLDPFRPGKSSVDPNILAEFRSYLHTLIRRMTFSWNLG